MLMILLCVQQEDEIEDNGSECVICMCETRDTLILPCRHLCLCNSCADNLRYQANNCPICRAKFSALLQIRAMRRKIPTVGIGVGSLPSSLLSSRPVSEV
jgi:Zinc finger, C3HC4 type (RING finger)